MRVGAFNPMLVVVVDFSWCLMQGRSLQRSAATIMMVPIMAGDEKQEIKSVGRRKSSVTGCGLHNRQHTMPALHVPVTMRDDNNQGRNQTCNSSAQRSDVRSSTRPSQCGRQPATLSLEAT